MIYLERRQTKRLRVFRHYKERGCKQLKTFANAFDFYCFSRFCFVLYYSFTLSALVFTFLLLLSCYIGKNEEEEPPSIVNR